MKITRIETIPVRVPIKPNMTMITAHGKHADSHYVIVKVITDVGFVGLGEATVGPLWNGEAGTSCESIIRDYLAPAIVGQDPRDRNRIRKRMDQTIKLHPFAKSAIDMALWDIAGKKLGVPVVELLGGAVRDRVPMKMVVGAFPVDEAVILARQFLDWGVSVIKVKVGVDPVVDLKRVTRIRELVGPTFPIGIDANGGWSLGDARRLMPQLNALNLLFIEQPIPPGDPGSLADLRRLTHIPIMADESAFNLTDAWTVAEQRAADLVAVYPGKNGGIAASLEIAHLAKAAGLRCHMGSNLELGIATAAMIHLAAACPVIDCETFPADILGPLYHEWDVIKTPLKIGPTHAEIPTGPGLGVELDESRLG